MLQIQLNEADIMIIKNELNIELLKNAFVKQLKAELSQADFQELIRRNTSENDKRICHSYDFIDANAVMADAFEACFKESLDFENQVHLDVIN